MSPNCFLRQCEEDRFEIQKGKTFFFSLNQNKSNEIFLFQEILLTYMNAKGKWVLSSDEELFIYCNNFETVTKVLSIVVAEIFQVKGYLYYWKLPFSITGSERKAKDMFPHPRIQSFCSFPYFWYPNWGSYLWNLS